jgi:hypothetical protein
MNIKYKDKYNWLKVCKALFKSARQTSLINLKASNDKWEPLLQRL